MKKLTAVLFVTFGLLAGVAQADSWAEKGEAAVGDKCQCTWSFDDGKQQ